MNKQTNGKKSLWGGAEQTRYRIKTSRSQGDIPIDRNNKSIENVLDSKSRIWYKRSVFQIVPTDAVTRSDYHYTHIASFCWCIKFPISTVDRFLFRLRSCVGRPSARAKWHSIFESIQMLSINKYIYFPVSNPCLILDSWLHQSTKRIRLVYIERPIRQSTRTRQTDESGWVLRVTRYTFFECVCAFSYHIIKCIHMQCVYVTDDIKKK